MRAGKLHHRVVLQNPTLTPDGDGGSTVTWSALSPSPVWASVTPATASAMEQTVASAVQSEATHVVEIRYHSGVGIKTRLTLGNRYLQVIGIQNVDEADVTTRLLCSEIVT